MRNKLMAITACAALFANGVQADNNEILQKIEAMQKQIAEQQAMIDSMKSQLNQSSAAVTSLVQQEVQKGFAQAKDSAKFSLGKGIEGLKLTGDARFRYERSERKRPGFTTSNLDRNRTRFRLGGVWTNPTENWEVGAGVATGDNAGSTSTNSTWGADFASMNIWLDYAYAKHKWDNISVTVGQQKNPFETSFLFWDGDVRPAGLTIQADLDPIFATLGVYQVRYFGGINNGVNSETSGMIGAQIGTKMKMDNGSLLFAAGMQHFDSNTSRNIAGMDRDYRFQIGDLYSALDTKVGDVKFGVYGHLWKNFGADGAANAGQLQYAGNTDKPEDNDMGWVLGTSVGIDKLKLEYAYGKVGSDSIYSNIKDADFGASTSGINNTDVKGHKLGASYSITKNFSVGATALMLTENEGPERDGKLFQLDAVYKF